MLNASDVARDRRQLEQALVGKDLIKLPCPVHDGGEDGDWRLADMLVMNGAMTTREWLQELALVSLGKGG